MSGVRGNNFLFGFGVIVERQKNRKKNCFSLIPQSKNIINLLHERISAIQK